jgi:hypothetical protein
MMTDPTPVSADKDQPLREDIRLLGRLLGDTVREQEGADVFDRVEQIRQLALRIHRDDDSAARAELDAVLRGLPRERTNMVVRAFSYFSHLANIAEDQHHIRRSPRPRPRRGRAARGQPGPVADACEAGRHRAPGSSPASSPAPRCAGADRPPDRGAAQEHPRLRSGRSPACSTSATAPNSRPRSRPSMTKPCAAPCCACGRRACCGGPSCR